ncbi:MAG: TusE/DsrC/DsvC family sulfur relay protein [Bdellovibrionales bacterium]|jgi:dissimilatory sulfite reductase related protein|nr:TusE/DsrC/DsvC family sulfur relay protein [Bdellovibrionales bacterium]MBT7669961.1 TusE/DsrC/DsvC family sulfur relay protein [Bdellovibrionales bacterium]MBT7768096.1 TusE/DsrC/DsvC family sulfur relay protein [Bdellovibrionales bacterium]
MTTKEIAGKQVELDADGHLVNVNDWSDEVAKALALEEEITEINDKHMQVINFMRKEFETSGSVPSIRKITKQSGVNTKEMYSLFPGGPARKAAKIGGLPKPKGCI